MIKHFNDCPAFQNESFVDDLKHPPSKFFAKDLFYIQSADLFCSKSFFFDSLMFNFNVHGHFSKLEK